MSKLYLPSTANLPPALTPRERAQLDAFFGAQRRARARVARVSPIWPSIMPFVPVVPVLVAMFVIASILH